LNKEQKSRGGIGDGTPEGRGRGLVSAERLNNQHGERSSKKKKKEETILPNH